MPVTMTNIGIMSARDYTGPGDLFDPTLAPSWWGLRAFSAAKRGSKAVRLRRDSDNAERDFATLRTGALDVGSIASFKGAANLFTTTVYDQVGIADMAQTTAANQPPFTLNVFNGLPAIDTSVFTGTPRWLTTISAVTASQPFTLSAMFNQTRSDLGNAFVIWGQGATCELQANLDASTANVPGDFSIYAGSFGCTVFLADNTWHADQMVFNSASSVQSVDGTKSASSDIGTGGLTAGTLSWFANNGGTIPFNGYGFELGVWSFGFTPTQQGTMTSNQRAYGGF